MNNSLRKLTNLAQISQNYLDKENYSEVISIQTQILAVMPESLGSLRIRASSFSKLNKYIDAISDYTQLINLFTSQPKQSLVRYLSSLQLSFEQELHNIYLERGLCYCCLKNFDKAIKDFQKAKSLMATSEVESLLTQAAVDYARLAGG